MITSFVTGNWAICRPPCTRRVSTYLSVVACDSFPFVVVAAAVVVVAFYLLFYFYLPTLYLFSAAA